MSKVETQQTNFYFPIFIACLSLFALGWIDNARGPFFPLFLEATGVNSTQGSLFFAVTSFVAILSSAASSWFLPRYGIKLMMRVGAFLMTLCPIGLVLSPTLTGSLVTAFILGCSFGFIAVGQNVLIGKFAPPRLQRKLFALLHCFYALAALSAPLSVLVLKSFLSWNYILCGLVVFTLPLFFTTFFLKESKEEQVTKAPIKLPPLLSKSVVVWLCFLSFYVSSELMLSTRLVVLMQELDYSFVYASNSLSCFFVLMLLSRVLFFSLNITLSEISILKICTLSSLVLFMLGYFVWYPLLCLIGFFMGPVFPTVMELLSKKWPQGFDILVARVITVSSLFVVINHLLVGRGTDIYGVKNVLYVVPLFLLLSFVVTLFYKESES